MKTKRRFCKAASKVRTRKITRKQRQSLEYILVFSEQLRALLPVAEVHREAEIFACIEILNEHCNRFLAGEDVGRDRKAISFLKAAGALKRNIYTKAVEGFGYE